MFKEKSIFHLFLRIYFFSVIQKALEQLLQICDIVENKYNSGYRRFLKKSNTMDDWKMKKMKICFLKKCFYGFYLVCYRFKSWKVRTFSVDFSYCLSKKNLKVLFPKLSTLKNCITKIVFLNKKMSEDLFRAIAKRDVRKISKITLQTSGEIDEYNKKG